MLQFPRSNIKHLSLSPRIGIRGTQYNWNWDIMVFKLISHNFNLLLSVVKVVYTLHLVKQGRLEPLKLPSEQYQLEVEDSDVARLTEGSTVLALKLGRTRVLLKDTNADDPDGEGRSISAIIRVAQPASLELDILPTHT
jgi:hypothetical protein